MGKYMLSRITPYEDVYEAETPNLAIVEFDPDVVSHRLDAFLLLKNSEHAKLSSLEYAMDTVNKDAECDIRVFSVPDEALDLLCGYEENGEIYADIPAWFDEWLDLERGGEWGQGWAKMSVIGIGAIAASVDVGVYLNDYDNPVEYGVDIGITGKVLNQTPKEFPAKESVSIFTTGTEDA